MSEGNFVTKVVGAASQGAVGAVVGATLSAVTEPVVNKILVERKPLGTAIAEHTPDKISKFFATTISTNLIKFPFFEAVNVIVNNMSMPPEVRGTVTGMIFTTATLPITNYRFRKSMNLPIDGFGQLYQAYLPTVGRDVVYGVCRNKVMAALLASNPDVMKTPKGRFAAMFLTVIVSCVVSAPGNELRGYWLQPKDRAKPFFEFFDPVKTIRSTTIGGLIMSTSLATGAYCTPYVEELFAKLKEEYRKSPVVVILLLLALFDKLYLQPSRFARIESKLEKK